MERVLQLNFPNKSEAFKSDVIRLVRLAHLGRGKFAILVLIYISLHWLAALCMVKKTAVPGQKSKQHLLASHRKQQKQDNLILSLQEILSWELLQTSKGNEICPFS